jgi:hypothetical protein
VIPRNVHLVLVAVVFLSAASGFMALPPMGRTQNADRGAATVKPDGAPTIEAYDNKRQSLQVGDGDTAQAGGGCDEVCNDPNDIPLGFSLGPTFPNPSRGAIRITYAVPWPGSYVTIRVFDIAGRQVATLVDEHKPAGRYAAEWGGRYTFSPKVAPGTYFIRMEGEDFSGRSKLTLLK